MNKHIKDLAIESKLIAAEPNGFDQIGLLPSQRAFAEAIIRRCANIAWQNTPDTEELLYGHLICDKITEYFGIE
jgi:hypothetical protein